MRYAMLAIELFLFAYGLLMIFRGVGGFAPTETTVGRSARFAGILLLLPLFIGVIAAQIENRPWGLAAPETGLSRPGTVVEIASILLSSAASAFIVHRERAIRRRSR